MSHAALEAAIETPWERRDKLNPATRGDEREAVEEALDHLDAGRASVAEPDGAGQLARQPVAQEGGAAHLPAARFKADGHRRRHLLVGQGALEIRRLGRPRTGGAPGFRAVPGAIVRRSAPYRARRVC
ncbi:MAG: hypothetical protein KatS3mg118_0899 [Paracoccaceae bacterium]|nr:MAG: hypothetical protein KatS3mg118_0899 [Paracoccaceae bacterium]